MGARRRQTFVSRTPHGAQSLLLEKAPGTRYLQRTTGEPFQIRGYSLWSLAQSTQAEQIEVLTSLAAKGFNSIVTMSASSETALQQYGPARGDGLTPFTGSKLVPNETYWEVAVDHILTVAASLDMVVQLAFLYFGHSSANDGFRNRVSGCSEAECYAFGEWLGHHFEGFDNLIYWAGGDNYSLWDSKWQAIVDGLLSVDSSHLMTAHPARTQEAIIFGSWVSLNMSYQTASSIVSGTTAAYSGDPRPVYMGEGHYEGDGSPIGNPTLTPQQATAEMWQALLANACGINYGAHPAWCNGWICNYPSETVPYLKWPDWKSTEGLESVGTVAMQHLHEFFESIDWPSLVGASDTSSTYITSSRGSGASYVTAACTSALAVVYTQGGDDFDFDLTQMSGNVFAEWIDPSNGDRTTISTSLVNNHTHTFNPPPNAAGGTAMALHLRLE